MLNILTGLPKNKKDDNAVCNKFANSAGTKIILGSSTMKMFCRELNINPDIKIVPGTQSPRYFINGIDFANEGVITLNECFKILSDNRSDNTFAKEVVNLIIKEDTINFIIGTADNGEHLFYKQNNLLPRSEIIKKIIELLKDKKITTEFI
ncbi:MAG: hypothetical protein K5622_06905 [Endomicrobiaceae bacterium]|nr:hypothetical protein [Endomicrobiaceae bacterium]